MASVLQAVLLHTKAHVTYPATQKALLEACNNFSDVPSAEKEWVTNNLPAKTYKSAYEVMEALLNKA
jgi:hypothetical protein